MKALTRSGYFRFLFVFFLSCYLTASFGSDFFHNHEPDAKFHSDCPACQWQALQMEDFPQAGEILGAHNDPLELIGYGYYFQSVVFPSDIRCFSRSSRAPPPPL
jgi:hypothetical protein